MSCFASRLSPTRLNPTSTSTTTTPEPIKTERLGCGHEGRFTDSRENESWGRESRVRDGRRNFRFVQPNGMIRRSPRSLAPSSPASELSSGKGSPSPKDRGMLPSGSRPIGGRLPKLQSLSETDAADGSGVTTLRPSWRSRRSTYACTSRSANQASRSTTWASTSR